MKQTDDTFSVDWGDWDNDGDLDLATGNTFDQRNRVYANSGSNLVLAWSSLETEDTASVDWGDWDGDGDLDLAGGRSDWPAGARNRVYVNNGDSLVLAWSSPETDVTRSVAWGDWDGDGDLDLAAGNGEFANGQPGRLPGFQWYRSLSICFAHGQNAPLPSPGYPGASDRGHSSSRSGPSLSPAGRLNRHLSAFPG